MAKCKFCGKHVVSGSVVHDECLPRWIPVTERTPLKEFEEAKANGNAVYGCLAVIKHYGYKPYITKVWHDGLGFIDIDSIDISASITHWMPLPSTEDLK